jgi:UDP-N-acetylglucosamine--dolichyl-phosphate N-acetylglucosaminephosphotransferase
MSSRSNVAAAASNDSLYHLFIEDAGHVNVPTFLALVAIMSLAAFFVCMKAIPMAMGTLFDRGIYGIDINKTTKEMRSEFGSRKRSGRDLADLKRYVVPESLGIVIGPVALAASTVILLFLGLPIAKANAALTTMAFGLLLGFVDDVLDVRWRYKIIITMFIALPLVAAYDGGTSIVVPLPLRDVLGTHILHLGPLYLVAVLLVCVFCCNSINILAGVNGVEVGQSIVLAVSQMIHNAMYMWEDSNQGAAHRVSLGILAPFTACSLALYWFNRYPSRVFVGDSYTYLAGITLAVAGISGSYTKTMLLFFLPQLINFTLSIPQLLRIVPCPRHRVPNWIQKTDRLENSRNYTILNAILAVTGPLHERTLTNVTLLFCAACSAFGFYVRYSLAGLVFEVVE